MPNDNEPTGIRHSHIDGTLSIIGADGWPYSPEETADLLRDTSDGQSLELLQRVSDALRALTSKADGAQ
ncbi:hypothetical protein OHB12_19985 [Nocardia sp. NBC_01730]|uniref:hypothetical protein n=1 Tax=Nocardia sp. NBC_01730 TaxID=2975998 RepID=UPI002E126B32|nr:hypothetical protein OHB12_19985 [Nocardia sp. NBC_01730]